MENSSSQIENITNDFKQHAFGINPLNPEGSLTDLNTRMNRNSEKIIGIVAQRARASGVAVSPPPLKVLQPILESIRVEEDKVLQDMWANLILNYVDSNVRLKIVVYPDILKQLSTNEVIVLQYMRNKPIEIGTGKLYKQPPFTSAELANLLRLGLVKGEEKVTLPKDFNIEYFDIRAQRDAQGSKVLRKCLIFLI